MDASESLSCENNQFSLFSAVPDSTNKSPVLMVSTDIHRISKEIDGKMLILQVKPRHVTPQIDCLGNTSPVLMVSTHIYGVSKEVDGENIHFQVNLGM